MKAFSWSRDESTPDLLGRKKVDWSFVHHGDTTIPRVFHRAFDSVQGGKPLEPGAKLAVTVDMEGKQFPATLRNARRGGYGDTYKFQFNGPLLELLQRRLQRSMARLSELHEEWRQQHPDARAKNPQVVMPDHLAEFVDFYATGEPATLRLEIPARSSTSATGGMAAMENDLDRRKDERLLHPERFDSLLQDREARGDYSVPDEWSRQKVRRAQGKFRERALINYDGRCAVCDLDEPALLDAAHLEGWQVAPERRLDPSNGILLCVLHHRALDRGILRINNGMVAAGEELIGRASLAYQSCIRAYLGMPIARATRWPLRSTR